MPLKNTYAISFKLRQEWFENNKSNDEILKPGKNSTSRKYDIPIDHSLTPDWMEYSAVSEELAKEKVLEDLSVEWPQIPRDAWEILECYISDDID